MAITSSDIQNQSFKIERRGYDVDEVDVFLERVASEIDDLNDEIARLRVQVKEAPLLLALRLSLSARLLRLTKRQSLQASILLWLPRKTR